MLNLNSIMIGSMQARQLAAFYEKVIGQPAEMVDDDYGFLITAYPTDTIKEGVRIWPK